jgi:hypothetical protein
VLKLFDKFDAILAPAPPWREDIALRIAHALEQMGVCRAPRPKR